MKRSKNLIELSRDHHHGLLLGWKIKQGLKSDVETEELLNYVSHFAAKALFPHFAEEERQVLVYLDYNDEYYKKTIEDHLEIREIINRLSPGNVSNKDLLIELAGKVERHIRFEERELFPYLERVLSLEQLDAIGKLISELHQPYSENYPNAFWAT